MNVGNPKGVIDSTRAGSASTLARANIEKTAAHFADDELEISSEMRGVLVRIHGEQLVDPELKALLKTSITERRANDVLQKVKFGYYKQPLVVKHVANALAEALTAPI